jgi:anti-sigma28 factor (negative regulator of flagellin synthesis)
MCRQPGISGSGSEDNWGDQVRLEKIEKLKIAIAENTYQVSAAELARRIIDQMLRSRSGRRTMTD